MKMRKFTNGPTMVLVIFLWCAASGINSASEPESTKGISMSKSAKKKNKVAKKTEKSTEKPMSAAAGATPTRVKIVTNFGEIKIELFADKAPISTANFIAYVNDGFYDGTIFHRVISNFMIQGGGMNADLSEKANKRAPIKNEADNGLKNLRGTLAMARTQIVDSATAQFFINLKDNEFLDHGARDFGYAVFGKVISGMDVVDKIAKTPTGNSGFHQDVPKAPVIIEKAEIVQE